MIFLVGILTKANSSDNPTGRIMSPTPQRARVRGSASEIGNTATVLEKRDDKASFMAWIFPYKYDSRQHIMGFNDFNSLS